MPVSTSVQVPVPASLSKFKAPFDGRAPLEGVYSLPLPLAPTDLLDPGSINYQFSRQDTDFHVEGRHAILSLPVQQNAFRFFLKKRLRIPRNRSDARAATPVPTTVPLIVLFKGQGAYISAYDDLINHLTGKGIAVLFLDYATNFFDADYVRMAQDSEKQIEFVLASLSAQPRGARVDTSKIVWVGMSKGSLVELFAMTSARPPALALFFETPLDVTPPYAAMNHSTPSLFFVGDKDTRTPIKESQLAYDSIQSAWKQLVVISSYTGAHGERPISAEHGSFSTPHILGRTPNTMHYFAHWRYATAAAMVLEGSDLARELLFGKLTTQTALPDLENKVLRSAPF